MGLGRNLSFLLLSCLADSAFWLCLAFRFQLAGAPFWPSSLVCHRGSFIDGDGEGEGDGDGDGDEVGGDEPSSNR